MALCAPSLKCCFASSANGRPRVYSKIYIVPRYIMIPIYEDHEKTYRAEGDSFA